MQEINNKNRKVKKRFKDSYLKKKYLGQVKYLRGLIESDKRLLEEKLLYQEKGIFLRNI